MENFNFFYNNILIKCDNTSAICLTKNPIQHSRTKYIEIRHHFIRDHVQRGDVDLLFIDIDHQLEDIFTKPLIVKILFFVNLECRIPFRKILLDIFFIKLNYTWSISFIK